MTHTPENPEHNPSYPELDIDQGLRLRQLQPSDAARMFDVTDQNRAYLLQWLPWPEHTQEVADSLEFTQLMIDRRKLGQEYGYGIELDGKIVGHISLMHLQDDRDPEIGYWVASEVSGRGIVTKAAARVTQFGMDTLGLSKIIIRARTDNVGSNRIAEKLGYTHTSEMPDGDRVLNIWEINS